MQLSSENETKMLLQNQVSSEFLNCGSNQDNRKQTLINSNFFVRIALDIINHFTLTKLAFASHSLIKPITIKFSLVSVTVDVYASTALESGNPVEHFDVRVLNENEKYLNDATPIILAFLHAT